MSGNHIRGISATLSLLDENLCEFEQWANGHEVRSVLYEVRNTLSGVQRQEIAKRVAKMQRLLREVRDALSLEGTVRSVDRMIVASCAIQWSSLVELESNRLRRYGEVPPTLAQYLDPVLTVLDDDLRAISKTVLQSERRLSLEPE
ncbi:MAG: hypothetical protein AB1733_11170 [Thermodesulfobacteriota bacterium]